MTYTIELLGGIIEVRKRGNRNVRNRKVRISKVKDLVRTNRQVSQGFIWTIFDRSYIDEIAHVFPAPGVYLLRKYVYALGLLKPGLQEKDIADMVTFFGKDVLASGEWGYYVRRNAETWTSKASVESELFMYRERRFLNARRRVTLTGFINHSPGVKSGLWNGVTWSSRKGH